MKKEVSCRPVRALIDQFRKQHLPTEALCAGVPYALDFLEERQNRIEWEDFCQIIRNARRFWSDDAFVTLGCDVIRSSPFRATLVVARFLFAGPELYLWISDNAGGPGKQLFGCIVGNTTRVDRNHFITVLTLPSGYSYCREFFLITKGALSAAATLIGLEPARVNLTETEHGAMFDIHCPDGASVLTKIRRIVTWPFEARSTAQELKEANEALLKRNEELEETQEKVKRQAAQLKAAYDISQVLRSTLDLDSTLEAICRSLVDIARFGAAEVAIGASVEGEPVNRMRHAGMTETSVPSLTRPLEIHGERIGQLALWLASGFSLREAEELLAYILPTVSMAIGDALSFKLLTDYRTSLEVKVAARTGELKQINEELKEAQAGRDRLFSSISHEFRTPLTLILGPLEKLLETTDTDKDREWLHLIKQNAHKLLDLINQLLDLSKLQSGKMELTTYKRDVIPFLRGIVMSYQSLAETQGILLDMVTEVEHLEVYLDAEKTEKIMNNLLSNAIKFTTAGGRVRVAITEQPSQTGGAEPNHGVVEIKVRDTGIGIPENEIPRIFDRFYQVDGSSTRARGGAGIGLALAKELAELHHGSIRVLSVHGKGTEFNLTLPLGRDHLRPEEIAPEHGSADVSSMPHLIIDAERRACSARPAPESQQTASALILIVEDNADVRKYIRESLPNNYNVVEAEDGDNGITVAQKTIPDLVISDVMMPGKDGFELCRALKTDEKTSHIPVILLTAKAGIENKIQGLETGADDYLIKPFEPKELVVRIKNLIELRRNLRNRFASGLQLEHGDPGISSREISFIQKVKSAIARRLSDQGFGVEQLAEEVFMSRVQLHRKLNAISGHSASDLIREMRLNKAMDLLRQDGWTVADVAYQVGYSDPSHFSTRFREFFGVTPSDARKRNGSPPK